MECVTELGAKPCSIQGLPNMLYPSMRAVRPSGSMTETLMDSEVGAKPTHPKRQRRAKKRYFFYEGEGGVCLKRYGLGRMYVRR